MCKQKKKIILENDLYKEMIDYATQRLPEEACGIVAGVYIKDAFYIRKIYFLENKDHAPNHFSINPLEQLDVIKKIRAGNLELLGCWHSHTTTKAVPSPEDIRLAYDSNISYLILSFKDSKPVIKSFHIENGDYTEENLTIL